MKKIILFLFSASFIAALPAQNLVVNGDAESLPRGTGWTVISQGAATCLLIPTNNMINWTMKPDGSVNYPLDHTTGVLGGTVFFSGCDTYFTGPFEVQQTVDVSADAATIDLGTQLYIFSGYLQTPVSNQTDRGRFIVDFMNASNTVLGTSYTSNWQSEFGGSGTGWVNYTNTRTAPTGTRKIRIRMQTELFINQPAINAYFDDISLTKPTVVPLGLLSFSGNEINGNIRLNWKMASELNCEKFELQRSADGTHFSSIASLPASGSRSYQFTDQHINATTGKYFYRLKMTGFDGSLDYSHVAVVKTAVAASMSLYPNPANDIITVAGLSEPGVITVISSSGSTLLNVNANSSSSVIDVSNLPSGVYVISFSNQKSNINKKLLIRH